jgi:hypothetical protein
MNQGMISVQYVSRKSRIANNFDFKYNYIMMDSELSQLASDYPKACKTDGIPTAAMVWSADGEIVEVWFTWDSRPYLDITPYYKVISYLRKSNKNSK